MSAPLLLATRHGIVLHEGPADAPRVVAPRSRRTPPLHWLGVS